MRKSISDSDAGFFYWALVVQLISGFFIPPVSVGTRLIYFCDLWCFAWTFYFSLKYWGVFSKRLKQLAIISSAILLTAYFSGFSRVPISIDWEQQTVLFVTPIERGRELVISLRFISWIWASIVTWVLFSVSPSLQKRSTALVRVLSAATALMLALMIAEKISPFREWIAAFYKIDLNYVYWANRVKGPLRSPVETSVVMSFSGLLLFLYRKHLLQRERFWGLIIIGTGLFLTHTVTPAIGLAFTIWIWAVFKAVKVKKWIWVVRAPILLTFLVFIIDKQYDFVYFKFLDFINRFAIWGHHWRALNSSVQSLVFGLGFYQFHCDNSFLFILTRTGVLGFAVTLLVLAMTMKKVWRIGDMRPILILGFILTSGLMLDFWIYRAFICVFLSGFIPVLAVQCSGKKVIS